MAFLGRGFVSLLSISCFFVTASAFAEFELPKACEKLVGTELERYGLGKFSRPDSGVNRLPSELFVEFSRLQPQSEISPNLKWGIYRKTDDKDGYEYAIAVSQFDVYGILQTFRLNLNGNCEITGIDLGGPTVKASTCKLITEARFKELSVSEKQEHEINFPVDKILCKRYSGFLAKHGVKALHPKTGQAESQPSTDGSVAK